MPRKIKGWWCKLAHRRYQEFTPGGAGPWPGGLLDCKKCGAQHAFVDGGLGIGRCYLWTRWGDSRLESRPKGWESVEAVKNVETVNPGAKTDD